MTSTSGCTTDGRAACAPSFLDLAAPGDRVVSTNSFSKAWLMTGWRLGWIVAPPALMPDLGKLIEYNTSCSPVFVQRAGVVAVTQGESTVAHTLSRFRHARDYLVRALAAIAGMRRRLPAGAMYVFFRVAGVADSLGFCKQLVREAGSASPPEAPSDPKAKDSCAGASRQARSASPRASDDCDPFYAADPKPPAALGRRDHFPIEFLTLKGYSMKSCTALFVLSVCLASPPVVAQIFSWDPLKDVENALPEGAPNEGKIIQARQQVREMSQDALSSLYEIAPGTKRAIEKSAGYAVFSTFGVKLFFAGGTTGKGIVVNSRTERQTFMKMVQVQGGWDSASTRIA